MKKVLSTFVVIALLATVYFVFIDKDTAKNREADLLQGLEKTMELHPVYNRISDEEKYAYKEICAAINDFSESTSVVYIGTTIEQAKRFGENFQTLYRDIIYEQSEIFLVDPYQSEMVIKEIDKKFNVYIEPTYLLEKDEALRKKERMDKIIEEIVENAEKQDTEFDKILYVYDHLLKNCSYDESLLKDENYKTTAITAYGCLVEGKTVCSGYTLAFDAIMKRLGFDGGAEFNNYSTFSILSGHVWNYYKIGDEYYYFDLTWDDTGYDSSEYKKYFDHSHQYFAVTEEELSKTNFTMTEQAPVPECNGTEYNYFIYKGYNISEYSLAAVKKVIAKQADQNYIAMRFDSYAELLRAETELLEESKIYSLLDGVTSLKYVISKSGLYLYILLE